MSTHALLSPSSASRWMACPGSVALSEGLPDKSSEFADEGTAAHELAAWCLSTGSDASARLEYVITVGERAFVVDLDMATNVQLYVQYVRDVVASTGGELLVEQRLPISHLTGEPDAHGTSDAVVLADDELIVIDLKYGRGVVVDAEHNEQLQIYALAALEQFGPLADFQRVRVAIHQPRLGPPSEWAQPVADLLAFGERVRAAAEQTRQANAALVAGESQCRFCKAKATCPALVARVVEEIGADFDDIAGGEPLVLPIGAERLGHALAAADLIEGWIKAVRGEVESLLLAGQAVPGFKLVQGKKGNRQWSSKDEAEALLKAMRIKHDQMYDYTVISPTSAEKLAKAEVIGPRQWPKVQALITQSEGKPSVAPESDKRPALAVAAVAEDFNDVSTAAPAEACDLV